MFLIAILTKYSLQIKQKLSKELTQSLGVNTKLKHKHRQVWIQDDNWVKYESNS